MEWARITNPRYRVVGTFTFGGDSFFKKCLNQALVIPNLVLESKKLDCTGNVLWNTFKHKFCTYGAIAKNKNGYKVTDNDGLREYLEEQLQDQFGDKYNGYYTVFFIGEKANWNGFSYFNSKFGVYFDGHNRGTLAHELMHAMTLAHTFDGVSPTAKFTYEAMKTDNIMDYSHNAKPPIDRKVIYHWQWKILNNKIR